MGDIFANSHDFLRRKAEQIDRESDANSISIAKHAKVKADAELRAKLARPEPRYKPNFDWSPR
jgi:hypothetical protein